MQVIRLHSTHDLRLSDEPCPIPLAGERALRVTSVGVCGSDLLWYSQQSIGDARLSRPLVLGHEFAAVTENGERVAVDPAIPCGGCETCLRGNPNLCPQVRFAGHGSLDGALREWLAWDSKCLFPLPDRLSDDDGALLEPLGVALHAVDLAHLRVGMSVGVFGCGPIGLLIVQLSRLAGAQKIVATDLHPHRLDAARAFGAAHAFQVSERLPAEQLHLAAGGRGVDVAFEASGEPSGIDDAIEAVAPGGRVILVGIPAGDVTSFSASQARRKGLTIQLVRRMKFTYPRAIDLVARGLVDVRSLVTHRFPLAQAGQAFATAARREGIKVIVQVAT